MTKEQIDACVILELAMGQNKNKEQRRVVELCRKYLLSHVAKYGNGCISLPALGEIWGALLRKVPDILKREHGFNLISDIIEQNSITISSPTRHTYTIVDEILKFDMRIEPADALRIAEALTEDAIFVTLDQKLIANDRLQKKFNVKIKLPY